MSSTLFSESNTLIVTSVKKLDYTMNCKIRKTSCDAGWMMK
jgi:hypothetical protein